MQFSSEEYRLSRWLFFRGLGITYLVAFVSLADQVRGLVGQKGLLPANLLLDALRIHLGFFERFWKFPTLFWMGCSDGALIGGAVIGVCLAILLILNLAPRLVCTGLWVVYLSYVSVGREFFSFQWDNLLLETGFIAIFFSPSHLWKGETGETLPRRTIRFLLIWLLFRLHFESGCSKWMSGEKSWWNLTAMDFYYETAPIPTWLGWLMYQMPHFLQALSVILVCAFEVVLPFYIFASKRWRVMAALILIGFQTLIHFTGNYTFFNLLSVVLCLLLIDDETWVRWFSVLKVIQIKLARPTPKPFFQLHPWIRWNLVSVLILLSILPFGEIYLRVPGGTPLLSFLQPFRSVNGYGLFAAMTKNRWELEIQGSLDGNEWRTYPFRYKPGDLKKAPPFVAPYHPRLDFQCWFLTFDGTGDFQRHQYLMSLLMSIFKQEPQVMKLLDKNPFPQSPKYLRLLIHRYKMTSLKERWDTGAYWKINETRSWSPIIGVGSQTK